MKLISLLLALMIVFTAIPAFGYDRSGEIIGDIVLVRPLSLAATVIGTALFIVSLPFAIPSGSVGYTAQALISDPFKYTFTRPLGAFTYPGYEYDPCSVYGFDMCKDKDDNRDP